MLLRLFLLFAIVPALELYLLIRVGSVLGAVPTLLLVLLSGLVGASLARREGFGVMQRLQHDLARGIPPAGRLVEGLLVFVGGLLLLAPGLLTDLFGLLLIFGPTRRLFVPYATEAIGARLQVHSFGGAPPVDTQARPSQPRPSQPRTPQPSARAADHPFANPFDDLP